MAIELIHDTFLGLPPEQCRYEDCRVALVRVPYDGTTSYVAGTREGPAAIMAASQQIEPFDLELQREVADVGICALPALLPTAAGPEQMVGQVEQVCRDAAADGKFVFTIGGEHSVTIGAARACHAHHGELSFLQIDAHLDLRPSYEGSPFSHASAAYHLLQLGSLVQVGVRTACPEELQVIADHQLRPLWGHEIANQASDVWIEQAIAQLGPRVYVTVDVDGLDPSIMPATGTPVPGGLHWYDTLALLRAVGQRREVVGCDVVELAPSAGPHSASFAAALLVYKMIGYFVPPQSHGQ